MTYSANRTEGAPGAPLFLTFHGTGGTEDQFHGFASELMPDAHVVSPRGDGSEMGALRYFRRTGEGVYDMDDLARAVAKMRDFVEGEVTRTGAERVIGLGYSNGANILAAMMLAHPGLVTDAVLMHPLIPWGPAPQPGLATARVLITAGERDPIGPKPVTEALIGYLAGQGARVQSHWHPGGHEIARSEIGAVQEFLATETV